MATIQADLDSATSELLDQAAAARDCSREEAAAQLIAEALHGARYDDAELLQMAQAGLDDLDNGRWVSHEQMNAFLEERRQRRQAG